MKKHYHICPSGKHKWAHEGECNLSKHCHCGFSRANDLAVCLKVDNVKVPEKRFTYVASRTGFRVDYKGAPIVKVGMTKAAEKIKIHPSTAKKLARNYEREAAGMIVMLENGDGPCKVWSKIRKLDKALKVC